MDEPMLMVEFGQCQNYHPYPLPGSIICYIDGSFMPDTKKGGAGICFSSAIYKEFSRFNCAVPVPPPRPIKTSSPPIEACALRAELYAALAAMHVITTQMRIPVCCVPIVFKQDSMAATKLLPFVATLPKAFSVCMETWAKQENKQLAAKFSWGTLTPDDLMKYADILDMWWFYCRGAKDIKLNWVKAHQQIDPSQHDITDRLYNAEADALAKQGNAMNKSPDDLKRVFELGFPLFSPDGVSTKHSPSPSPDGVSTKQSPSPSPDGVSTKQT